MATLTTAGLTALGVNLPPEILDPWLDKVQYGSAIAALSGSAPMKFGTGQALTFDIGEAEYVGEGANKSSSTVTSKVMTTAPFKFQKTVRWTDEVKWSDEDEQLGVIAQILQLIQPALSRALDFGIIHGINPADGTTVTAMTKKLANVTNTVTKNPTDKAYLALDAADALVLAGDYIPSDVALSPALAAAFMAARSTMTEQKLYPNLTLNTAVSELEGHRASVSRTINAQGVITPTPNILGIVGDFAAIRWGIQRSIGLEMIQFGDPDGGGDLKRNNQIAFRAEVVYGWGIADLDAFALITGASE